MISDFEYLERVVAGINALANPGADVQWNVEIGGRQFDVAIQFRAGLSNFMVLIEVKDHARKTSVNEIEAFITKARDQRADKITFFTRAGYQSGAIEVANRHNVDLFQVNFLEGELEDAQDKHVISMPGREEGMPLGPITLKQGIGGGNTFVEQGPAHPVHVIEECLLHYWGGQSYPVPNEPTQMEYYVEKSKLSDGRTLRQLISAQMDVMVPVGTSIQKRSPISPPLEVTPPDDYFFPEGVLEEIELKISGKMGRALTGNVKFEPTMLAPRVEYKNVRTNETATMPVHTLPVGEGKFDAGKFYCLFFPLRYFHCDRITGEKATITLVESFQSGDIIRARYTQQIKYSSYYMRVTDRPTLKRLRKRLSEYNKLSNGSPR